VLADQADRFGGGGGQAQVLQFGGRCQHDQVLAVRRELDLLDLFSSQVDGRVLQRIVLRLPNRYRIRIRA